MVSKLVRTIILVLRACFNEPTMELPGTLFPLWLETVIVKRTGIVMNSLIFFFCVINMVT